MATSRKPTSAAKKVAKKAAKKVATKAAAKSPKKKSGVVDVTAPIDRDAPFVAPVVMTSNLDLFSDEDQTSGLQMSMREGLDGITQRAKTKQVSFHTPAQMVKMIIPLDELNLQNAIGAVGLRSACVFELIAPEHVGKTTLMANWLGKFALQGCQSLYIECEGKQMDPNRFLRCMHTNRKVAQRVFHLCSFTDARTLPEAEHKMQVWAKEARRRSDEDPRFAGKPLIVVVDPWGKLMSQGEAGGFSDFGLSAQQKAKVKVKETGQASNLGHAKYAHAWTRRLPSWLREFNVLLIIVQHQNEHIDMGFSPVSVSDAKNDTTIGGKAFAQLAAYRATLTNSGQWSVSKSVVGLKTRLMFIKNSYGPKSRTADIRLKFEDHIDSPTHFEPVTYYSYGTADWMAANGILDTKLSDDRYTCDTIGCVAVTAEEFYAALKQRPDVIQFVGTQLGIEGYAHVPMRTEAFEEDHDTTAATGGKKGAAAAVSKTPPPPPPADLVGPSDPPPPPECMSTPEDVRQEPFEPSIGGPSSLEY